MKKKVINSNKFGLTTRCKNRDLIISIIFITGSVYFLILLYYSYYIWQLEKIREINEYVIIFLFVFIPIILTGIIIMDIFNNKNGLKNNN